MNDEKESLLEKTPLTVLMIIHLRIIVSIFFLGYFINVGDTTGFNIFIIVGIYNILLLLGIKSLLRRVAESGMTLREFFNELKKED